MATLSDGQMGCLVVVVYLFIALFLADISGECLGYFGETARLSHSPGVCAAAHFGFSGSIGAIIAAVITSKVIGRRR
jgi:hypothetical protein